jgi:hypothetical protein
MANSSRRTSPGHHLHIAARAILQTRNLVLLLAVGLVLSTGLLFVREATNGGASPLGSSIPVRNADSFHADEVCEQPPTTAADVIAVVSNYDPKSLTVTVSVSVCVAAEAFAHFYRAQGIPSNTAPERATTVTELGPSYRLRPGFARFPVAVAYSPIIPGGRSYGIPGEPIIRETTLGQLFARQSAPSRFSDIHPALPLGRFVLPLAAAPSRYPLDWYGLRGELALAEPAAGELYYCPTTYPDCTNLYPFHVILLQGSNMGPFVVRMSDIPTTTPQHIGAQIIALRLERSEVQRAYVICVALIPLVLTLLLCLLIFRKAPRSRRVVGPEVVAGVAAVLLAILPIRAVLVPAEISELTLLDYWLGFNMATLAAVACVAVWRGRGHAPSRQT